jgi:hypothetical protein
MQTLTESRTEQQAQARMKFVELAWQDKPDTGELLRLAELAGMPTAQADQLLTRIEAAKADRQICETLPKLRQKRADLFKTFECVRTTQTPIIEEAQAKIQSAANAVNIAQSHIEKAEESLERIADMFHRGEIPESELPKEVQLLHQKEKAEAERVSIHKEWCNSKKHVEALKQRIDNARRGREQSLSDPHTMNFKGENPVKEAESAIERLTKDLAEAETALKKAAENARKAGFDIPM